MTNGDVSRSLVPGMIVKIGFPLLIGLITLVSARVGGMPGRYSLALTAVVTLGSALVLFIVDTEARLSAVDERMAQGFARIDRAAELSATPERSIIDSDLLAELLRTASQPNERVNPLLQRLARREVERVTSFVRQLPVGSEITYEGEDRDWLLGLTREAERSIDAISLSAVDAGARGPDGGLWTSDLGLRYVELMREAIARKVRIRRIFVFESAEMARAEDFQRVTQVQRAVGVEVRMVVRAFVPEWMQPNILDLIVFDGIVSYEATPLTEGQPRPGLLRTLLAPVPARVRELEERFERLWEFADPNRKIDE